MQALGSVLFMIALVGLAVGLPLAILRSLDEIKRRQRRIEERLDELATRLTNDHVEL